MDEDSKTIDEAPVETPKQKPVNKKRGIGRFAFPTVMVLVLMAASAAGAFFWQQAVMKSSNVEKDALQQRVKTLEAQIAEMDKTMAAMGDDMDMTLVPDKATSDNVKASIETGNTAALLDVFASQVNYAIAATEAQGVHTAEQAVKDLDYLDSATGPWNFDLPQSELDDYADSIYYGKYFPAKNGMVGKSADGKLVSFIFNSDNKITTLFMSIDADIVKE